MSDFWQSFWMRYRVSEINTEKDLYFQVGKTVNKQPIPLETFRRMVERIVGQLQLSREDHLLDFCCGNGLLTYELAAHVGHAIGVDFTERLIHTARQFKSRQNLNYRLGDALAPLASSVNGDICPTKFLMFDALSQFEPAELDTILSHILQHLEGRPFRFLLGFVPRFDLRWNFYDTAERRARYVENEKHHPNANDGLGRWWQAAEIEAVCSKHGLFVQISNQPPDMCDYRMDALVTTTSISHLYRTVEKPGTDHWDRMPATRSRGAFV